MNWLRQLIKRIFLRKEIKLLEAHKNIKRDSKKDFKIVLKRQANLELDDRNGYKIMPNIELKDMI